MPKKSEEITDRERCAMYKSLDNLRYTPKNSADHHDNRCPIHGTSPVYVGHRVKIVHCLSPRFINQYGTVSSIDNDGDYNVMLDDESCDLAFSRFELEVA